MPDNSELKVSELLASFVTADRLPFTGSNQ
jgi:hypothetical protein